MPEDKLPIPQFAAKIKAKYPQYKDINDTLLVQKIVEKFPEYRATVDLSGIEEPVKKKEPSGNFANIGTQVGSFAGQSEKKLKERNEIANYTPSIPKTIIQQKIEKNRENESKGILDYAYNLKTPEEKKIAKDTPELAKERAYDIGEKRLLRYIGKGGSDPLSEIKKTASTKTDAYDVVQDMLAARVLDDYTPGSMAKGLLSENKYTGETKRLLEDKAIAYDKVAQPFRDLGNVDYSNPNDFGERWRIYDAVIKAYANKNPLFAKQARAAGVDFENGKDFHLKLEDKAGSIINEILNDENFTDYIKNENPGIYNSIKLISDNLLTDNKAFGANVVANEISRERQKIGYNNPIVEFDDRHFREENDLVANTLYANDPQKKKIYDEIISQNPDKYIDTPNLLESIAHGAKGVYSGIWNTVSKPFDTKERQIKDIWNEEASFVSADPNGINKFMSGTGHVLGLVAALGGVSNVLGAGGIGFYSSKVAPALSGTVPFAGNFWDEATMKYPDSPVKAATSAGLNTILYGALSQQIFPAKKVEEVFSKIKPEVGKVAESLTSGAITREAARRKMQTLLKQGIDLLSGGLKNTTKISAELSAITAANRGLDKLMMDESEFSQFHHDNEMGDTFKSLFLDNAVLGAMTQYSKMRKGNKIVEESIYEAATNPLRYERAINEMQITDPSVSKESMLTNLRHVAETKKALDDAGILVESQKRYLFESLRVRTLKELAAKLPEANLTRRAEAEIKRGEEVAQGILDGKEPDTIVTTEDQKEIKEKAKADADRNKLVEKGQTAVQKLLDEKVKEGETEKNKLQGIYRDIAKSNPVGFLQEIADQVFGMERKDGERVKSESDAPNESEIVKRYGADVVNTAKELFPLEPEKPKIDQDRALDMEFEEDQPPSSVFVQRPEEVKNISITEIKPNENPIQENTEGTQSVSPEETTQPEAAPIEPIQSTEEGGPPIQEPPVEKAGGVYAERPGIQLSFRGLQNIANEFGYEDIKSRDRVSDVQERQNAINTANEWAEKGVYEKNVQKLLTDIGNYELVPTAKQRLILEQYLADKVGELRKVDKNSSEFNEGLAEIKRIKEVAQIARQEAGASLRIPLGGYSHPVNNFVDAAIGIMEAQGTDVLTAEQKAEVERMVSNYEQKAKEADEKIALMEARMMELEAAKVVGQEARLRKASRKRTVEQLKQERGKIVESIKEKLKAARQDTQTTVLPYLKELAAITPDVAKLVGNFVEQGITELSQIIDNIHEIIKPEIPGVTKDDIRDVIGGKYSQKKTRSEYARQLQNLKTEARLLGELDALLKGEAPKTEKKKTQTIQKIADLRKQIKEVAGMESEMYKTADELLRQKEKEATELSKELSKAEKELNAVEKKEAIERLNQSEKEIKEEIRKENYKTPGQKKLEQARKRIEKDTEKIKEKIAKGDFEKEDKPVSIFDSPDLKKYFPKEYKEMLDALAKKEDAQRDYDIAKYKAERAKRGKVQKGIDFGRAIIATTKAVKSGIDDSAVMMQNIVAMLAHPRSAVKALKEHALDAISEKRFRRYLTELHNSSIWPLMQKSGLDITDPQSLKEQNKEEIFDNNLLNKDIKIKGKKYNIGKYTTRPFERAFTSLGNAMRVNMFTRIAEKMMQEGKTFETHPKEFKDLATVLNTETGRGKLHTQVQRASQLITAGIWSPRLMASRINMLGLSELAPLYGGKGYYSGLGKDARKLAAFDMAKFIGAGVALMGFAGSQGADIDDDPESPTFGTIKVGNKKYNTWGGFTPYVKTIYQGITGHREIAGERKEITRSKLLGSFFRSRLTPAAGVAVNLMTGKQYSGEPVSVQSELTNLVAPLSIMAVMQAIKKDGAMGLLTEGLPSFIGVNVADDRDFGEERYIPSTFKIKDQTPDGKFIKRSPTPEEYKSYKQKSDELLKGYLEGIEDKKISLDKYGDIMVDIDEYGDFKEDPEGTTELYSQLTKEQKKDLESKLKSKAKRVAKKELFGDDNE